jgi:hypothetical protein
MRGTASTYALGLGLLVPRAQQTSSGGGGAGLVGVLLFAIVLSLIPIFVAYRIADRSGQSKGLAIVLGILLGWIGVLIVYLMGRGRRA